MKGTLMGQRDTSEQNSIQICHLELLVENTLVPK